MSVVSEIVFEEGIAFDFAKMITRTLPKAVAISEVIIQSTIGALSGGATGTYIANSAVESITLRIDGKEAIVYNGASGIAGQISMGIALLREFYQQMHIVAMPDESYIIELPDAIPKNHDVQIIIKLAENIASIQTSGGDRTTLASSTIDIKYKGQDKLKARVLVPYINWSSYSHGARTGNLPEYLPTIAGKLLRKLIMITHDANVLANDTYDRLIIAVGAKNLVDGSIGDFRRNQSQNSHVALSTGFLMVSFPNGIKVPASTLKLNFVAGTAGVDKNVHVGWLAY